MKIPIKSINEIKTPDSGVLLFVDQDDSKLKGKKSNNEVLDFSSNSMKYYKCASVDTTAKTWSGHELVYNEAGYYELSDVITENLTYSGFTPFVGTMYNENATFTIGQLFTPSETLEGCIFAANMQTTAATYNGETINLENVNLVDAPGYTDGTKALTKTSTTLLDGINGSEVFADGDITVALSVYLSNSYLASGSVYFVNLGNGIVKVVQERESNGNMTNSINVSAGRYHSTSIRNTGVIPSTLRWYHIVLMHEAGVGSKVYVNGVEAWQYFYSYESAQISSISNIKTDLPGAVNACMKDLQIYNRVLSEEEIMDLHTKAKLPTT